MMAAAALLVTASACAGERHISADKLPQAAQTFIKQYFPADKVVLASEDRELFGTSYDVMLSGGTKLEFDGKGEWKDVECMGSQVPAKLVPAKIAEFASGTYPNASIVKIERKRNGWEIKLSGVAEVEFDTLYNVVDID